ncbi:hypothetical protein ACN47E_003868 [Coniothyrium glycines]
MSAVGDRPLLTSDQVSAYFRRIKLPESDWLHHVSHLQPAPALEYLTLLQKHHLVEVPFENLTLHYSSHRAVSLHPDDLFRKIVADDNGRGGYCMENNTLFGTLLRTLGFTIYPGGARVFDAGKFTGWSHMVNFVTIGDNTYHVDVGFGGNGPIVPMLLHKSGTIQKHISPGSARLQWRNITANVDSNQRLWVYEYRKDEESDWDVIYCYTELEFQPQDYAMMNYFTSTSQRTFFTSIIVGEKKIWDSDGKDLVGSLVLNGNNLKWRINGKKERNVDFVSEAERLDALEKHFGIKLGQADQDGIRGLPSEIK